MDDQKTRSLPTMAWTARSSFDWGMQSQASNDSQDKPVRRNGSMLSIFPDKDKMRDQMLADKTKLNPNISKLLKEAGFAQWMSRHHRFEQVTLLMISVNAIWIAIDTDWNKANVLLDAQPQFQIAEHVFCSFFLYEWTVRFLAFRKKRYALRDAWFIFDSVLVSTMVLEAWVLTVIGLCTTNSGSARIGDASLLRVARLLRLTRMARMARLLRAMPELLILIKGMLASLRSVVFTLGLLLVIVYIYAIAFTQICTDSDCQILFPSVATAMHTLFLNGALMDNLSLLTSTLEQQNLALLFLFYTFVLLSALTLMNMLVGVVCEVMSAVAATERECITLDHVNEKIRELVSKVNDADADGDDQISKEEFMKLLREKDARRILSEVGVDVVSLVDLADTIFDMDQEDSGASNEPDVVNPKIVARCLDRRLKIHFSTFMQIILNLRGTNQASFKDIVELRKFMRSHFTQLEHKVSKLEIAQQRSTRYETPDSTWSVPGLGAAQRRRGHSRSQSPAGDVSQQKTQCQSPSPSSILVAESQVVSHDESALDEAAQEFQRHVTESLDDLLVVHQSKMAACEAQTESLWYKMVHVPQLQQKQQDQQRHMLHPQGSDRLRGHSIRRQQELEAARVSSVPGIRNAKEEDVCSVPLALLNEERSHTRSIPTRLTDGHTVNLHALVGHTSELPCQGSREVGNGVSSSSHGLP